MSTVSLSIKSTVPAEDIEETLEALKPIIRIVYPEAEIHLNIEEED